MKYFLYFPQETDGDSLHKMSNPVFWEKCKKKIISLSFTEFAQGVVMVKKSSIPKYWDTQA